ncbi:MAG TPA: response regulator [Bacteroidales bacterium]|nr:response regulator [Bacteroidales bacterium]
MSESKLTNKLVLIVEDDVINNELLVFLLKRVNMQSLSAYNGKDAIELFKAHPKIDLVLMDLKIPGMNGYEITEELKKIRAEVPIIAQTAYALSGDREKAMAAGCDEYIKKPIIKEELYRLMENFF